MKIILTGGTGQVGKFLAEAFLAQNHEVVVISRSPVPSPWKTVQWDGLNLGDWAGEMDGVDVVLNLAGRSVNCRYNKENQRQILESRTNTTRLVGKAIEAAAAPPELWINASTATIYSHRYDSPNDDITGIHGLNDSNLPGIWKFSVRVADAWEGAMDESNLPSTRTIKARMSMVMGSGKGSVFDVFTGLALKGLGGSLGDGKQYVAWIHELDFLRAVEWMIKNKQLSGAINVCSPNPIPNHEFMSELRKAVGAKFGLPATKWMLEIGAFFLKTETELLLKSRRVVPQRLLDDGFTFQYPNWGEAAREIRERHKKGIGFSPEMRKES